MVTTLAMIQSPINMSDFSSDVNPIGFIK